MQLIKNALIVGLLFVLASAGVFAMYNRGMFNDIKFNQAAALSHFFEEQIRPKLPGTLANLTPPPDPAASTSAIISADQTQEQLATLSERGQAVSQEIGKVLGDYVQVNEADEKTPLHEKAFEYGQYLYCQQVIKEYEASTSATN